MRKRLPFLLLAGAFSAVGAWADITMTECFSSAPNVFGSPSWSGYVTNAIAGIQNGCAATGDPNSPTYYQSSTTFQPTQLIVTDYNSWNGVVNPGGAFSGEYGNRLHDGLFVNGNGAEFSLSELNFNMNSSDPADALNFTGGFSSSDDYSDTRVGIINLSGGGEELVTSGSATQLVNELVYVGIGNAFCSGSPGDCGGGSFTSIGDLVAYMNSNAPFTVTNTYSLVDANGDTIASVSSVANITAAPEPMELIPVAGLLFMVAFVRYRRFHRAKA
jgi:hypothetical protein